MPMQEAFSHCEQLVRAHDKDRFLAALFAPPHKRQTLFALYAFDIEIARIALIARQPLAGEVRLQWWREVLAGDRAEEARANPVAAALWETVKGRRDRIDPLDALLDARRADLYDASVPSLEGLEEYAEAVIAPVIAVAMRLLCDHISVSTDQFAAHAGNALLLERIARGADRVVARRMPAHLTVDQLRERIAAHLQRARALLPGMPAEAWPTFLPLALVPLRLARRGQTDVPQWRRQWALWRAARTKRF
jgi:phytoene synthase